MRIVGVQMDIAWEDSPQNLARAARLLDSCPLHRDGDDATLVALPEMFHCGFSMNVAGVADEGAVEGAIQELARRHDVHLVAGIASRNRASDQKGVNEAVVVSPQGKTIACYRKIHPFSPAQETHHYLAGEEIVTFPIGPFHAAAFVCYDLRFPEIFRIAALRGVNLFIVIANWPSTRVEHWTTLLRARAIENQACVLGVNRCGSDPNLMYPGRSIIVDYLGRVLAEAGDREQVIHADIDLPPLEDYRRQWPFLADAKGFLPR